MKKIILFDLLKTIAIIMVVFTHSGWSTVERNAYLFPYTISMAVPIFMLIYGYLSASGFNGKSIQQMFDKKSIYKKIVRIGFPFTIAFIVGFIFIDQQYGVGTLIQTYLRGGESYGGYYTPIMIQLIFLTPFLFSIVRKKRGLATIFVLNLSYEILRMTYYINGETYRLLAIRYIFLVSCGMYVYLHSEQIKEKLNYVKLIGSMILGAIYIYIVIYTSYQEVIIQNWENTSMMCAFWIVPIFMILYKHFQEMKDRKIYIIGRASFHIFLVQMVFIDNRELFLKGMGNLENAIVNILICVPLGLIFYHFSTPFEKKLNNKIGDWVKSDTCTRI